MLPLSLNDERIHAELLASVSPICAFGVGNSRLHLELLQGLGAAHLDTGDLLTPQAARRLACDAGILPAVMNGAGQPLDVGRERRLITGPVRRALVLRDGGCAFPDCDKPAQMVSRTVSASGCGASP